MTTRKVIIIGGGSKRRYFKDQKGAEIWCCNGQMNAFTWLPRVDKAFNLHRFHLLKQYGYSFDGESDFVKENPETPFLTMDRWPKYLIPNWVRWELFPWHEMAVKQPRGMYHCGTFDWFVAYASFIGIEEITIHGVNLKLDTSEPGASQTCLEYWCGYAEGKGMTIKIAPDSTLFYYSQIVLTNTTYGLDDAPIYIDRRKDGMPQYDYKE